MTCDEKLRSGKELVLWRQRTLINRLRRPDLLVRSRNMIPLEWWLSVAADRREYGEKWKGQLFRGPVGRDYGGKVVLWRPDVDPSRFSSCPSRGRWILRTMMTIGLLLGLGLLGAALLVSSWWWTAPLLLLGLALLAFLARALYGGVYAISIEEANTEWWDWLPRGASVCRLTGSTPAGNLAMLLETVAGSQAAAAGIVNRTRLSELHKQVWAVITTGGDIPKATVALTEIVEEVAKLDPILTAQTEGTAAGSSARATEALREESIGLSEELRAFRNLVSRPEDIGRDYDT